MYLNKEIATIRAAIFTLEQRLRGSANRSGLPLVERKNVVQDIKNLQTRLESCLKMAERSVELDLDFSREPFEPYN